MRYGAGGKRLFCLDNMVVEWVKAYGLRMEDFGQEGFVVVNVGISITPI